MRNGFDDFVEKLNELRGENRLLRKMCVDLTLAVSLLLEHTATELENDPAILRARRIICDVASELKTPH